MAGITRLPEYPAAPAIEQYLTRWWLFTATIMAVNSQYFRYNLCVNKFNRALSD